MARSRPTSTKVKKENPNFVEVAAKAVLRVPHAARPLAITDVWKNSCGENTSRKVGPRSTSRGIPPRRAGFRQIAEGLGGAGFATDSGAVRDPSVFERALARAQKVEVGSNAMQSITLEILELR